MDLADNLANIKKRIDEACHRSGRETADIRLMAVSKKMPPERIDEAAGLGLQLFGENRIQEAKQKIPLCAGGLEWHGIGHLQTNKARDAVSLFSMLHGIDSERLAEEINKQAEKQAKSQPILLEVNVAAEASKFGFSKDTILESAERINTLSNVEIHGLMTMAPWSPDSERSRPVFRTLKGIADRLEDAFGAPLPVLSMGMSGDFEVAIEEGSTLIRIGTALFGKRPDPKA